MVFVFAPTEIDDSVKPTASLGMGASRFYELGIHCSKYACIGGMAPASFDQWEHRERPTGLSGMQVSCQNILLTLY